MEDAIDAANAIASEHLEIITKNPFDTMTRIRNAGAIFLGEYASEPLGDYFAGPNHILPTNGTARFFSPVNVDDFIKKPVSFLIPDRLWRKYITRSRPLQKAKA